MLKSQYVAVCKLCRHCACHEVELHTTTIKIAMRKFPRKVTDYECYRHHTRIRCKVNTEAASIKTHFVPVHNISVRSSFSYIIMSIPLL